MTAPKRWPKAANRHRLESIFQAAEIGGTLTDAKSALRRRNLDLCLALIAQAEAKARLIAILLENAPAEAADDP